jgi:hypothetical protein
LSGMGISAMDCWRLGLGMRMVQGMFRGRDGTWAVTNGTSAFDAFHLFAAPGVVRRDISVQIHGMVVFNRIEIKKARWVHHASIPTSPTKKEKRTDIQDKNPPITNGARPHRPRTPLLDTFSLFITSRDTTLAAYPLSLCVYRREWRSRIFWVCRWDRRFC